MILLYTSNITSEISILNKPITYTRWKHPSLFTNIKMNIRFLNGTCQLHVSRSLSRKLVSKQLIHKVVLKNRY